MPAKRVSEDKQPKGSPASKQKKATEGAKSSPVAKKNKTVTEWSGMDLSSQAQTGEGKPWNLKLSSWNVDGLRACCAKGGAEYLTHELPDVLCLQETKVSEKKLPEEMTKLAEYPHCYWLAAEKEGYSSVGLLSKTEPVSVQFGFKTGGEEHNSEGRMITAEFDTFYLVNVYVPNSGRGLVTLGKRMDWDPRLREHVVALDKVKPVIICGDLNVAHKEIDLKNPKSNKKNAGFTQEERDSFTELLEAGFVDSYRHFNPEKVDSFTFWTYMMGCRAKNVGWRLDYFLVSSRLVPRLADSLMRDQVFGSDHCPVTLLLEKPE
eukprot:GFUD01007733.1.p1 GENE.GFUD01007733.1~~GFUD01007733.1.p1  ORF type:complete len:320 (-),score=105.40 GFUD01007733.1:142-1101(-)